MNEIRTRAYHATTLSLESSYPALRKLHAKYNGAWEEAFEEAQQNAPFRVVPEEAWTTLQNSGVRLVLLEDEEYPAPLKEIPLPPFGLYIKGNLPDITKPRVAIVGTRKATDESLAFAKQIAEDLGNHGVITISGLAMGIDGAAHVGALETQTPTFCVLANGLQEIYPRHHERLAEHILKTGGGILSEYPWGAPALPYRFLERNRIVSGLSQGTVVIEAPKRSGALVTARFALDQNREVMVVPGPARHPNFRGSHALLRSGATLVTNADEILETLGLKEEGVQESLFTNEEEARIIELLRASREPLETEEIRERLGLSSSEAQQTLTFLLMKQMIKESSRGYICA